MKMAVLYSFSFISAVLLYSIADVSGRTIPAESVVGYLRKYGYLTEEDTNRSEFALGKDGITSLGLTRFQKKMGIRVSGKLDAVTEKLLNSPRCGEQDIRPDKTKVDSLVEKISEKGVVKYNVKEWSDRMSVTIQNQTLYHMFETWATDWAVKVVWSKTDPDVNIVLRSGKRRSHQGKNLLTEILTEAKMEKNIYTIYFYSTAAEHLNTFTRTCQHALGHVFGRQHSGLHNIMSPVLRSDDIFSSRHCEVTPTAVFSKATNNRSFFVKDDLVWEIRGDMSYSTSYPPVKVPKIFKGLDSTIDAAFTSGLNWESYVFKGSKYWRFTNSGLSVDKRYPQPISYGWPGVPDDIDAAFTDQDFSNFFFKDDLVYKYIYNKTAKEEMVANGYPTKISKEFPELTQSNYDAVLHYYPDNALYFFKGLLYWKMPWVEGQSHRQSISGPHITKYDWHNVCIP